MNERELKFRIWVHIDKAFTYFDVYEGCPSGIAMGVSAPMQFTGLLDSQGKEIYEGDIVTDDQYTPKVVCWRGIDVYPFSYYGGGEMSNVTCKVIGNIFENKELIN